MNNKKSLLSGNSVFGVSILVIITTIIIVYFFGIDSNRKLATNIFISLSVLASILIVFMTYGLYRGIGLVDDFPEITKIRLGDYISGTTGKEEIMNAPNVDLDELDMFIVSVMFWLIASAFSVFFLLFLEFMYFDVIFIVVAMFYWIYFKALKLIINKSHLTKGKLILSMGYSFFYTILYSGWMYLILYIFSEVFTGSTDK